MLSVIIFIILIILCFVYLCIPIEYDSEQTEPFDNFDIWNNNLTPLDNLDNLQSVNKPVYYNLTKIPLYNTREYNALLWHLRFKNLIGNRYAYDDINGKQMLNNNLYNDPNNDLKNWNNGNSNNNCHANNCANNNCHSSNCYEQNYAPLGDLPTCLNNKNCPVDKLP